jgi:maleylacetoacetate isomerase
MPKILVRMWRKGDGSAHCGNDRCHREVKMKLYTRWQNSAGERVRIALNLKAIPYDYVAVGTLEPGEYAQINPQELLPALEVDGQIITQSAAILDYLEVAYPDRPLLPADPILRAQAIAMGAIVAAEMHAMTVQRVRRFLGGDLAVAEAGVQQWVAHWLGLGYGAIEDLLARRPTQWPYCFGAAPGWADLFVAPQVANGRRLGLDLDSFPLVVGIADRCGQLEAFQSARPEAQADYPNTAQPGR